MTDAFQPDNTGRYELVAGPDGADCRRTDSEPDLALTVADLGALYLGGVAVHRAGRAPGGSRSVGRGRWPRATPMFATVDAPLVLDRVLSDSSSPAHAVVAPDVMPEPLYFAGCSVRLVGNR